MNLQRIARERRSFLRAVGAGVVVFPFFRLLEGSAVAQDAALRLVTIYHPHSASSPLFGMQEGDTETSFTLNYDNSVLEPLTPFQERLAIVEGLDLIHAAGHDAPHTLFAGSIGTNSTLDQYLAVELGLGDPTMITSLTLSVGTGDASNLPNVISLGPGGTVIPQISSPAAAFDKVFGGYASLGSGAVSKTQGQSVLDYLRHDVARLDKRLGPSERYKLEQHLTALRDLEKRLEHTAFPVPSATCTVPDRPNAYPSYSTWNEAGSHANEDHDLHVDIIAQAFACDLTRFVSFQQGDLSRGAVIGTGLDTQPGYEDLSLDVHNSIAHGYSANNPESWMKLAVQNRYNYSKTARLMQRLQEVQLLDDTVIVMAGEMGDPGIHSSQNIPVVVAGDAHGALKVGRRIKVSDTCSAAALQCNAQNGTSMTKLLVSVANAFGAELDGFGSELNIGPLSQIEA